VSQSWPEIDKMHPIYRFSFLSLLNNFINILDVRFLVMPDKWRNTFSRNAGAKTSTCEPLQKYGLDAVKKTKRNHFPCIPGDQCHQLQFQEYGHATGVPIAGEREWRETTTTEYAVRFPADPVGLFDHHRLQTTGYYYVKGCQN
jgi:hypothetical protein